MANELFQSDAGACVCSQLRRTARRISALYDKVLTPSGLTVTQHGLLVNIARAGEIGRSALALQIGMDRTTLTRNLKPLEKAALIVAAESADRRERLLCLSAAGRRKARQSYNYWEKAQKTFVSMLGSGDVERLRVALRAAEEAAVALEER